MTRPIIRGHIGGQAHEPGSGILAAFEVVGVPAPQGSKTAVMRGTRPGVIEGGSKTGRAKHRAWRDAVAGAARDAHDDQEPHEGPLLLDIAFRLPMPPSRPKWLQAIGRQPSSVKPDIDKLIRSTLDALTDAGMIRDDARVAALTVTKHEVVGWTGATISLLQMPTANRPTTNTRRPQP